jgi:hypothetical protein
MDISSTVLTELTAFKSVSSEDSEKVIFWQEQVVKIEKLIRYAPLYYRLKQAQEKLKKL